jgi:hypothetical protein
MASNITDATMARRRRQRRGPPDQDRAAGAGDGEQEEAGRPQPALPGQRQARLEQERIAEQAEKRAEVGERVQAIRRAAGEAAAEPVLEERPGRGQDQVGEADGEEEQAQDRGDRIVAGARLPAVRRRDRRRPGRDPGDQQGGAQRERGDVHDALAGRVAAAEQVGIAVAGQEQHLEEQHAGRPHRRDAAEPGEDLLAQDELHLEEQEGSDADRHGEEERGELARDGRLHARASVAEVRRLTDRNAAADRQAGTLAGG